MHNVVLIQFRNNYLVFQYYVDTVFVCKNIPLSELSNEEIDAILVECDRYKTNGISFYDGVRINVMYEFNRRRRNKIIHLKQKINDSSIN